jgi:hypothetical protein
MPSSGPALLYLVYGSNPVYQEELSYSVLSALRESRAPLRILLYCDAANQRPDLPVTSHVFDATDRQAWTFGGSYNHALKIFVLRHALERSGDRICFVDTDTAFRRDPALIFDRVSGRSAVMHADEGRLRDLHSWDALLPKAAAAGFGDTVHPQARMFNSGLIGVTPEMGPLLEEAAGLARDLYRLEPVFNIEQFVLGAVLGREREIRLAEDVVDHYWGYRRHIYHGLIPPALEVLKGCYTAESAPLLQAISDPAKPLSARLRARLHGILHGTDANYRFAYLACLAGGSRVAPEIRAVWADIALDMLQRSALPPRWPRDFCRFSPERLAASGLDATRQDRWRAFWAEHRAGQGGTAR